MSGESNAEKAEELLKEIPQAPAKEQVSWLNQQILSDKLREEVLGLMRERRESSLQADHEIQSDSDATARHLNSSEEDETRVLPGRSRSQKLGPYKLLQKLGEGGMGQVWMAEQQEPVRRRVALKLIRVGMDSDEVVARFEAERQALAMMDHQHIAKVLDAGQTAEGQPYFVMELVQGIPFHQYCDDNKLPLHNRLRLFLPVCRAVQHAHQKGIIHRDLKPSNVLVTLCDGEPVPKVIDFGMAKALQTQTRLTDRTLFTEFGKVIGTVQYMSPEQAEVNALDVDTRTDIYSLGVMLYELLAGSTPLDRETIQNHTLLEVIGMIKSQEPPVPSGRLCESGDALVDISAQRRVDSDKLLQALRGDLDWVVMKALEKERSRRYATADALAEDIENYLNDEPVVARPPSTTYRIGKALKKHRLAVVATGLVFMALVGGIAGTTWQAVRAKSAERTAKAEAVRATNAESEAKQAVLTAEQASEEAKHQTKIAELNAKRYEKQLAASQDLTDGHFLTQAHAALSQRPDRALAYLNRLPKERRGFAWSLLVEKTTPLIQEFGNHSTFISDLLYANDGAWLIAPGATALEIWDTKTGQRVRSHPSAGYDIRVCVSPDGLRYAYQTANKVLQIREVSSGDKVLELALESGRVNSIAFSRDGQSLVTSSRNIQVWNLKTGQAIHTIETDDRIEMVRLGISSTSLVGYRRKDKNLVAIELDTGKVTSSAYHFNVCDLSVSDAGMVVTIGFDWTMRAWSAETLAARWSQKAYFEQPLRLEFNKQSDRIASVGCDRVIRIRNAADGTLEKALAVIESNSSLAWSPNGTRIATVSGKNSNRISEWRTAGSSENHSLEAAESLTTVACHPEQPIAISGGANGNLVVARIGESTPRATALAQLGDIVDIEFSPSGKQVFLAGSQGIGKCTLSGTTLTLQSHTECPVAAMDISSDGKQLAVCTKRSVGKTSNQSAKPHLEIYNASSLAKISDAPEGYFRALDVDFSSDGKWLATCGTWAADHVAKGSCFLRSTENLQSKQIIRGHHNFEWCVCFSPDSRLLATGSEDRRILLRRVGSDEIVSELVGHQRAVVALAFSPNGELLASAGYNRDDEQCELLLWDVSTGLLCAEVITTQTRIGALAWSSDGKSLLAAGSDGKLRVWSPTQRSSDKPLERWISESFTVDDPEFYPIGPDFLNANHLWANLGKKKHDLVIRQANNMLSRYYDIALEQQNSLETNAFKYPTENLNEKHAQLVEEQRVINAMATSAYIQGMAYKEKGLEELAIEALKKADRLSHGRCWDPQGYYWSPASAARKLLVTLESEEVSQ